MGLKPERGVSERPHRVTCASPSLWVFLGAARLIHYRQHATYTHHNTPSSPSLNPKTQATSIQPQTPLVSVPLLKGVPWPRRRRGGHDHPEVLPHAAVTVHIHSDGLGCFVFEEIDPGTRYVI
jgi:hypothetical protein